MASRALLGLVYAASVVVAASAAEVYTRQTGSADDCRSILVGSEPPRQPLRWGRLDPELGWVLSSERGANPQGFRDPRDFSTAGSVAATRVMVLGDSFMYGVGPETESPPRVLERELGAGYAVYNLGMPGWGIDQMYLSYLRYRDVLRPSIVILAYIDDDVPRVLAAFRQIEGFPKPAFRLADDGSLALRTRESDAAEFRIGVLERSVLYRCAVWKLKRFTSARPIVRRLFVDLAAETARRGERLVIVRMPEGDVIDSYVPALRWFLLRVGAPPAGAEYFETFELYAGRAARGESLYREDGHFNARGSALMGTYLARAVRGEETPMR